MITVDAKVRDAVFGAAACIRVRSPDGLMADVSEAMDALHAAGIGTRISRSSPGRWDVSFRPIERSAYYARPAPRYHSHGKDLDAVFLRALACIVPAVLGGP